jgi:hypothetical protein
MKKDAVYFPHYANARHDRKIKRVLKELGIEGYGIYFMLLEVLREQVDLRYPLSDIDLLADEFGTSEPKVKSVIMSYDLFNFDEKDNFFSIKQIFYLQPYFEKTERARTAAIIRWDNAKKYANALPMQSESNASKVKEKKVKESIDKNILSDFDFFWACMPNKVGKHKAKQLFVKLGIADRQKILATVQAWANYKPFETYTHPHPTTYLSQRRWEDAMPSEQKPEYPPMKKWQFHDYKDYVRICRERKMDNVMTEQEFNAWEQ